MRVKAIPWIVVGYVDLVRGIPVLVFLFIVYYLLPVFGVVLPKFTSAIIALSLYFSGFVAEILRGAIASIPQGQIQAAVALGMLRRQVDFVVIYPQAIRIALPSLMNLSSIIIKATSVVSIIGVWELMAATREIVARTMLPFQFFIIAMLLYFILCFGIVRMAAQLEKRYAAAYK